MAKKLSVGDRYISDESPCFIIAEAGSNHNQDKEMAKKLIVTAAEAGADAVKFQTFRAESLYCRQAGKSDYLGEERSIYDIIAENEMPLDWIPWLAEECQKNNILFLSTAFDEQSADLLAPFMPLFKVASYELTHHPLIQHLIGFRKPMILSTGAANMEEIGETVALLRQNNVEEFALLQCTARYPAPWEALNLRAIPFLRAQFDILTGLSDHSLDPILAPVASVALGGKIIEKHFTLDKNLPGPDHRFSLEPHELRNMIQAVRTTEQALGHHEKKPAAIETELRHFARRAVFIVRPIHAGEVFSLKNLAVLRRGNQEASILPKEYYAILGKKAARDLEAHTPLCQADIA